MATSTQDLSVISNVYQSRDAGDEKSSMRAPCAFCGGDQMVVVAFSDARAVGGRPHVVWLRCISCFRGIVVNESGVSPSTMPLDTPEVLLGDDLVAWNEVRSCLAAGANTAAVMMCRKLLFHIAVAHGLPDKNTKGRAPSFADALEHLEDEGVITKLMRPWADKIKDVGNEANHEIPSTSSGDAMAVAKFTRQLIMLAYELPAMVAENAPEELAAENDSGAS